MQKSILKIALPGLLSFFLIHSASAQTERGNWLLNGSGSFQHLKYKDGSKSTVVNFNPRAGIFVTNNLALGLIPGASLSFDRPSGINVPDDNHYNLSIGPFVRYYYGLSGHVKLFADGYYAYGGDISKTKSSPPTRHSDYSHWRLGIGGSFFITPSGSLDISVGYGGNKLSGDYDNQTDVTDVQIGFSLYLKGRKNR